jgi:acyl-homoserine-lactone acylase
MNCRVPTKAFCRTKRHSRTRLRRRRLTCLAFLLISGLWNVRAAEDPLVSRVTIYRDTYGVPHIVGETVEATFFGYGFAQAEDHLERMMLQYRDAQGRRAEVLGREALCENCLHFTPSEYRWCGDYLQRLLRTKATVLERKQHIDPAVYRILDAFARGVNYYIQLHRQEIPEWIDGVTAEDIEALERSQYFRFYSIHDALSKLEGNTTEAVPHLGSNQWAVEPTKSANGRIIHVEDVHMPWANRFQLYEAHLITPGQLNAGGVSWFGSPFFLDGFNDKITWSGTYNEPNIADVYVEAINPENHLEYRYEGQWRPVRVEYETFKFKSSNGMEIVNLPLYYTHHGPIVKFDHAAHRAYAVKLPNFRGVNYSTGLYGLMKASNLEEFKGAVSRQLIPRWNLLYTDSKNIFSVYNGNVARRNPEYDWSKPVPGWTVETEWGPYLPFERYPQVLNPQSGFLQDCNNPPWVCTRDSGLKPLDPEPYFLKHVPRRNAGEEVLNARGERLSRVLAQDKKFTIEEMIQLGLDTYIVPAEVIVPLLLNGFAADQSELRDIRVRRAVESLRHWDLCSRADSCAFTYLYFWGKSYKGLYSGAKFDRFIAYNRKRIDVHSRKEQRMALTAFTTALDFIQARFGKTEVPWGDINVVVRGGTFPLSGADTMYDPLHIDGGDEQPDGQIRCNDGWGHLMIVMEGQPKQVWSLLPFGQSESPASTHYNDQTKLHSQGRVKRFWLTSEEILANTESVWGDPERIRTVSW